MRNPKNNTEQKRLVDSFIRYLDCPCRYFAPSDNDSELMKAYDDAFKRGKKEGFIPMIVTVDSILWECLVMNTEQNADESFEFDYEKVKAYRKKALSESLPSVNEVFHPYDEDEEDDEREETEDIDEYTDVEAADSLTGYWDILSDNTLPLILAEIPVKNPWEVFAWLPFGGWNECPDTGEQMAAAKHWFELYGAQPALVTHDVLEYVLPEPVGKEKAMEVAREQYGFCGDIVDQGIESVEALAGLTAISSVWYFWWD